MSSTNDNDTTAILGYSGLLVKQPIKLDFKQFPSLSISGVTNSGKSCLVTNLINSTKLDTILVNAYAEDYKSCDCIRVSLEDVNKLLDNCLADKIHNKLIVFDECLTLISNKDIAKKLHLLLTKNRHMNLYIVCIFQELNKYNCSFKSLFASRCAMRHLQKSDTMSSLGTTIEDYSPLKNRQFILISDNIYQGVTYDL